MGYEGTTGTHIVWSHEACDGVWGGKNSGFDYIRIFFLTASAFAIPAEKEAFMIMIIAVIFSRGL
jgi:hypothetical protein